MSVKIAWLIVLFLPFMTGCDKDPSAKLVLTRWKLEGIKEKNNWFYTKTEENLCLEFGSDSTYQLSLSRNDCGGTYFVTDIDHISFGQPHCPLACCDSEYSLKFASFLPGMRSLSLHSDQLMLEGEVKMIFSKL
ncbi:MAG TPA: hypothetical protein DCQ58_04995 [Saprospirales bacterium]|nr:hypothetical protein [Saprospirales bacterium]